MENAGSGIEAGAISILKNILTFYIFFSTFENCYQVLYYSMSKLLIMKASKHIRSFLFWAISVLDTTMVVERERERELDLQIGTLYLFNRQL